MSTLGYILLFSFIGSVGSLLGGMLLLAKEKLALKISHLLASFAAGTLLGAAFFDLIPEAIHESEHLEQEANIALWILLGIVIFFIIERFIHWFHHHEEPHSHESQSKNTVLLLIISDTIHNFIDGIVIAATFLIDIRLGVVTTLAVAAHEIPQEIGDFGLMLHKKVSKVKIISVNILSASAALVGAVITYAVGESLEAFIPFFLALTAGFFIYIALSDLIPEIHHEKRKNFAIYETGLLLLGIVLIFLSVNILGHE